MAYTTVNKSTANFNTKLWAGNGSSQALTGVGHQTDMVWIKSRTDTRKHNLYDVVRGVQKRIVPNDTVAEDTVPGVTAFGTDGFTVGSETDTNGGSRNFVGWSWKAGTTSGINQDSATITPTGYSFNQTAGFSIIKYTGTGSTATLPHGLGATPNLIIIKKLTGGADNWTWKSDGGVSGYTGFTKYMYMNNAAVGVATDSSNEFQYNPTSTKFSLGTNGGVNGSGATYVAYCFANKVGYQKIGGYVGNGNGDGYFLPLGFRPKLIITHRLDSGDAWTMLDSVRDHDNGVAHRLFPHQNNAENTSLDVCDFLSNGVKFRTGDAAFNDTGGVYVYWAIGQSLVGSNNIPCTAR